MPESQENAVSRLVPERETGETTANTTKSLKQPLETAENAAQRVFSITNAINARRKVLEEISLISKT